MKNYLKNLLTSQNEGELRSSYTIKIRAPLFIQHCTSLRIHLTFDRFCGVSSILDSDQLLDAIVMIYIFMHSFLQK